MVFIDMHGENNDHEAAAYLQANLALDLLVDLTSHTYKVPFHLLLPHRQT